MAKLPLFGAGAYTLDSVNAESQAQIGLYAEVIESKSGKGGIIGRLHGTSGLDLFVTLPESPVLGLWSGNNRMFAVAGTSPSHLYEIHADGSIVDNGACGNALTDPVSGRPAPAQMFPNGNQLMVINGGTVWVNVGNLAFSDLTIQSVGFGLTRIGIAGGLFPEGITGLTLILNSSSGFTGGNYTILNVVDGAAVVAGTAGTTGATGGTATIDAVTLQPNLISATYTDLQTGQVDEISGTPCVYDDLAIGYLMNSFTNIQIGQTTACTGLSIPSGAANQLEGSALNGAQVGDFLSVTGGSGFTQGMYQVLGISYGTATTVTLNQDCGTAGSTGGTATIYQQNTGTLISSPTYTFTNTDLGAALFFSGVGMGAGTGSLYAGLYTVIAIQPGGYAQLNVSPGPVGATNCAATEYINSTEWVSSATPFAVGDILNITGAGSAPGGGPYGFGFGFDAGSYTITGAPGLRGGLYYAALNRGCGVLGTIGGAAMAYIASSQAVVSSQLNNFEASDVGQTLQITGGSGWTGGAIATIDSVTTINGTGYALLSTLPAGATLLATGGEASEWSGTVPAITGCFMDTYGIVAGPNTNQFFISANNNFLSWNAIDFGAKEGQPDDILAILMDHEILYLFGNLNSVEVWQDTGAANFPFQRIPGGFMHFGLAAQFSVSQLGLNGVAWLAWSAGRGQPIAVYSEGFQPVRVSTHAIEEVWVGYTTVEDAIAYNEIQDGHHFWVIHFPEADATWVYDKTASDQMGMPMWHQRGYLDNNGVTLHRQLQSCHAYGPLVYSSTTLAPAHYVGDHSSGNVYVQSPTYHTDNGQPILRQRVEPHMDPSSEEFRAFWHKVQLSLETGVGSSPTNDITVTLDYSRDFGHTFINPLSLTAPASGGYQFQRLIWRRLGYTRDMVIRFTSTSNAKHAWTDAFALLTAGTS
jgi:hypothetical protein